MLVNFFYIVLRIEHYIYCMTDCRLELPFHKQYYKWCRTRYEEYITNKTTR